MKWEAQHQKQSSAIPTPISTTRQSHVTSKYPTTHTPYLKTPTIPKRITATMYSIYHTRLRIDSDQTTPQPRRRTDGERKSRTDRRTSESDAEFFVEGVGAPAGLHLRQRRRDRPSSGVVAGVAAWNPRAGERWRSRIMRMVGLAHQLINPQFPSSPFPFPLSLSIDLFLLSLDTWKSINNWSW